MTEKVKSRHHVAFDQIRGMLDFLSRHVDLAQGNFYSLEARYMSKKLWAELAQTLNNCRGGTKKSGEEWSKYWSNFKNKLKNKVRILNKRKRMGSTDRPSVRPLTRIEKRALDILGPNFEPQTGEAPVDPPSEPNIGILQGLLEVKIERDDEVLQKKVDSSTEHSPAPERTTEEAEFVFNGESEDDSNESLMNTLYPKWLVEVERKRADAELTRARAEETRARASATAAAAAAAQAEALHSLAAAAARQADAVARIAAALDRAPQAAGAPPSPTID